MDDISSLYFICLKKAREKMVGWQKIGLNTLFGGDGFVPMLRVFSYTNNLFAKGRA